MAGGRWAVLSHGRIHHALFGAVAPASSPPGCYGGTVTEAVIVGAVRTPLGRGDRVRGSLREVHPARLAAVVLRALVERVSIDPAHIDDVIVGCVSQVGEQGLNVGRQAAILAGYPVDVPATTVDRQCGSSQQAVNFGAAMIRSGSADVVVCAGVESMSRVPMGSPIMGDWGTPFPPELLEIHDVISQGLAAEMIAERWSISRREADEFAMESQKRATRAQAEGRFAAETAPVTVQDEGGHQSVGDDQGIRPGTTMESLGRLTPAFRPDGVHHAGNSSQISDGAAALLLMSADRAHRLGLPARAAIRAQAVIGVDPVLMLTGPIPATRRVLERAGLTVDDIDLFEVNEAFASVVLAWARELAPDMTRVNVNGGAIALGHPLGASGARLMVTLLHELERTGGSLGLQTMCCGGGLGTATILDRDVRAQ
ncbi:MAG: acetyl-CoA C-acyltransferase, partial [Candidatus Dormibacteria bacterium]